MAFPFEKVRYSTLNSRQKESFNFQKLSAVLADYGFVTILLNDDWNGADFLALHVSGKTLKVQLKSRLTFDRRYQSKDIWIGFSNDGRWYLYEHDQFLKTIKQSEAILASKSWQADGKYTFPQLSKGLLTELEAFQV